MRQRGNSGVDVLIIPTSEETTIARHCASKLSEWEPGAGRYRRLDPCHKHRLARRLPQKAAIGGLI